MPEASDYLGSDGRAEEQDSKLYAPTKYKYNFRCAECGNTFSRVYTMAPKVNPECPKKACQTARTEREINLRAKNMARILEERRAPGHIGANVAHRAVDITARVIGDDYGYNPPDNHQDAIHAMAPKLPHKQQEAADNFFNPPPNTKVQQRFNRLKNQAIAGQFRGMSVNPSQVIGATPGQSALVKVGQEKLKN